MTPRPYHKGVDYPAAIARLQRGEGLRILARELGISGSSLSQGAHRHGWAGGKVGRKPRAAA